MTMELGLLVLQVTETVWGHENKTFFMQLCYYVIKGWEEYKTSNN